MGQPGSDCAVLCVWGYVCRRVCVCVRAGVCVCVCVCQCVRTYLHRPSAALDAFAALAGVKSGSDVYSLRIRSMIYTHTDTHTHTHKHGAQPYNSPHAPCFRLLYSSTWALASMRAHAICNTSCVLI